MFHILPQPGYISTVAGSTWAPSLAPTAATSFPLGPNQGIGMDAAGNLYAADFGNNVVVKVTPGGALTVVAGNGAAGYSGDNGPATSAQLNGPAGIAMNPVTGDLYITDQGNSRIRRVSGGVITTFAGTAPPVTPGMAGRRQQRS